MWGDTGSGKSISIISLGLEVFPNFSYKNVFFFDQQILNNAHKFPENTLIVRDENPQKAIFGVGSTRTSMQLGLLAETCRKAGLNLAFIEPDFAQRGITKIIIEAIDMDMERRITRLGVMDTKTQNYMGAIYIKVVEEDNEDWVKYNRIKDSFIKNIKKGGMEGAKIEYKSMVSKLLASIDLNIYKKKKERKAFIIQKYPTMTSGEIDILATLLEIELRKQDAED